jgi:multidrug efflux pump subunit AcrA (membrane-fusion protein)
MKLTVSALHAVSKLASGAQRRSATHGRRITLALFALLSTATLPGRGPDETAADQNIFHGRVEPRYYESFVLGPGESVLQSAVHSGQTVRAGDLLFVKCSPALAQAAADLGERIDRLAMDLLHEQDLLREKQVLTERCARLAARLAESEKVEYYLSAGAAESLRSASEDAQLKLALTEQELQFRQETKAERVELRAVLSRHLAELRRQLAALEIKAPFDGIVEHHAVDRVAFKPGDLVLELWQPGALNVRMEIWAAQRKSIRTGISVTVLSDTNPVRRYRAAIVSVDGLPAANEQGFSKFEAIAELAADATGLAPGDPVNITLDPGGPPLP